jgi:hypothetical protein
MVCDLMVFCPNGAQGDSPGQRPGFDGPESYQALKGRNPRRGNQCADVPRAALRFALGYLILPLWGGEITTLSCKDCPRFCDSPGLADTGGGKKLGTAPRFFERLVRQLGLVPACGAIGRVQTQGRRNSRYYAGGLQT